MGNSKLKELDRSLGLPSIMAISISAMLGSGIFVLPGLAAAKTGPSVWVAYLLAGLCVLPAALSKAELATAMPASGGSYVYLERSFGPWFGTVAGLGLWASMWLKSAFALLGFGAYLSVLVTLPTGDEGALVVRAVAMGLLGLVLGLNVLGVKKVGRAQLAVVVISLLGLVALVVASFLDLEPASGQPFMSDGVTGLVGAAGFVFVSYNGVTKVAAIAEEVKNPQRNLPLGILLSLVLVMIVYCLVAFTLSRQLPMGSFITDLKPVHSLAMRVGGGRVWPGVVAAVLGVLTMTSMANAGLLAASRFPMAMSRDKLLPKVFRHVHARFKTPVPAILLTGAVMALVIGFLDVEKLAKLASGIVIMIFIAEQIAVVVFRESRSGWYRPQFRAPFYPVLHAVGIITGMALLALLGTTALVAAIGVTLSGALTHVLYGRRQTDRRGVVSKLSRRDDLIRGVPSDGQQAEVPVEDDDAAVAVCLFGDERSPEMMIDLGAALANGGNVQATHFTEVEPQEVVSEARDEDVTVQSLRRRLEAMAADEELSLRFRSVLSRDLVRSMHAVSNRDSCKWLVMRWRPRERSVLSSLSPLGWLINHLPSNLAVYKDAGLRYVRKILVLPAPGPHDALVVGTADDLANAWKASVTMARFVSDTAKAGERASALGYLNEMQSMCSVAAEVILVGGDDAVDALAELSAGYDLIVMGAAKLTLRNLLVRSREDRLTEGAGCSVLTVRTPQVQTHAAYAERPTARLDVNARLDRFMDPDTVAARLDISNKSQLLAYCAKQFAAALPGVDQAEILRGFEAREDEQSTAVGAGVAIPHAMIDAASRSLLGAFVTAHPIDYDSLDGEPVDVFFATVGPTTERNTHLKLLSSVARLTRKTDILTRLRAATSQQEIRDAIEDCSRQLEG